MKYKIDINIDMSLNTNINTNRDTNTNTKRNMIDYNKTKYDITKHNIIYNVI